MKAVILAGGLGTRLSEETHLLPKPMVTVGGKPILWHILKLYSHFGITEFLILAGYKSYVIKEYFANYFMHQSDVTFNLADNSMEVLSSQSEPWKVTVIDTGMHTMTGGRILKAKKYLENESFFLTYGDGVADIDLDALLAFHQEHGKAITMTAVQPEGRFGAMEFESGSEKVLRFMEKPKGDGGWINGGFFVCEPSVFRYITEGDQTVWERSPLENLARDGELFSYKHHGFWKPMDTLRDRQQLEELWLSNTALWKLWE